MGRNNNKPNQQKYLKTDIDYDKLAEAIVRAHHQIKEQEEIEAKNKKISEDQEWHKIIGCTNYHGDEKWIQRLWHEVLNNMSVLISLFTFRKKDVKDTRLSFGLMQLGSMAVYGIFEWALYILAIFCIVFMVFAVMAKRAFWTICLSLIWGFVAVLLARIFRIAKFEIENLKDKEMVNMVFSANMAFIGVIFTVIGLLAQLL